MSEVTPFECWGPVIGYEGIYEVSNFGKVKRTGRAARTGKGQGGGARIGRILKAQKNWGGYHLVQLWRGGKYKMFLVHRLVAQTFLGPLPDGREVNHKNGNKSDNRVENLEYVTRSENNRHAYRLGLMKNKLTGKGESHPLAKLTDEIVIEIRQAFRPYNRSCGAVALAQKYGVDASTIHRAIDGRTWNHIKE